MDQELQKNKCFSRYRHGTEKLAYRVERYQGKVQQHLNGEVNLTFKRNHQETMEQKRKQQPGLKP